MLQVYIGSNALENQWYLYVREIIVSRLEENEVHCHIATRPEVEGLRVQNFVAS